jgi:hypothetical protein
MSEYTLKGWLVNNNVTTDNTTDQILLLEAAGHITQDDLVQLLKDEDSGLRIEVIRHVMDLQNRVVARKVTEGFSVDTGLVHIKAQPKGLIEDMTWNPKKNSVHASILVDKVLREALAKASVHILGEKGDAMFIGSGLDAETRASNGHATTGSAYTLHGRMIKIEGDDESVGLSLTSHSSGVVTKIGKGKIATNHPSRVQFYVPDTLTDGVYTVSITTQYSASKALLKKPRTATWEINVSRTIGTLPVEPDQGGDGGGGIYIDPNA